MKQLDTAWGCLTFSLSIPGAWYLMPWAYRMESWSPWVAYPLFYLALAYALYSPANLVRLARSVIAGYRINSIPFARKYGFTRFATPLSINLFLFLIFIVIPLAFLAWVFAFL